jgi:hypothetical protein
VGVPLYFSIVETTLLMNPPGILGLLFETLTSISLKCSALHLRNPSLGGSH